MNNAQMAVLGVIVVLSGIVGLGAVFTVHETEQAIVTQFGEVKRVVNKSGLHFKIPIAQEVITIDKRVLDFDARQEEVPTGDQKQIVVDAFVRYRIDNPLEFFKSVRSESVLNQRLGKVVNASLRQEFGDVSLATLLTPKRSDMIKRIAELTRKNSKSFGIDVIDVRIKHMDLPEENSQAIYRRMQTQREQEARKIRATGEKESKRIRADADKQYTIIQANARRDSERLRGEGEGKAQAIYNAAYGKNRKFYDFWDSLDAMNTGVGSSVRYIGSPDKDNDFFRYFGDMGGGLKPKR